MKTNHGVIEGYNGQAMVSSKHQIIIAAEAFGKGNDSSLLSPMLDIAVKNLSAIGKTDNYIEIK